ncbi:MAG: type II toxin-antitoxin system PemK/MazF family toxin [Dehalococcoidia bacterium]
MIRQGDLYWVDLPAPSGSGPGFRRPGVVIQGDAFNSSTISTTVLALITSQERRAADPGNVVLDAERVGLDRFSVVNVSQLYTVSKADLGEPIGELDDPTLALLLGGISLMLGRVPDGDDESS